MKRNSFAVALTLLLACVGSCWAEDNVAEDDKVEWIKSEKVKLQGLDKVTGRVFEAPVKIGQKVVFGGLEVYVRKALRAPPEEPNESMAFIEIYENKPGEERVLIFKGWMIASEPALNPFDHSVYDVWLKETIVPQEAPPIPDSVAADDKNVEAAEDADESEGMD